MKLDLQEHNFKTVEGIEHSIPECICLLKRQTLNTNRAICVVQLDELPKELDSYIASIRKRVAFKIGFFPLFWALGLQVVIICPKIMNFKPAAYVARANNFWAIVQSVYFVDPIKMKFIEGRTWGQYVTGKYQDAISTQLRSKYRKLST